MKCTRLGLWAVVWVMIGVMSCEGGRCQPEAAPEKGVGDRGPLPMVIRQGGRAVPLVEGSSGGEEVTLASAPFELEVKLGKELEGAELGVVAVVMSPLVKRQMGVLTQPMLTLAGSRGAMPQPEQQGALRVSERALSIFPGFAGAQFRDRWGVIFEPEQLDTLARFRVNTEHEQAESPKETTKSSPTPTVLMSSRQMLPDGRLSVTRLESVDPEVRLGGAPLELVLLVTADTRAAGEPQGTGLMEVHALTWRLVRVTLQADGGGGQ
ncbi:MAG: hypothetical protein AAFX99_31950 [Myxococcota bacterium]